MRIYEDTFSGQKIYPGKVRTTSFPRELSQHLWQEPALYPQDLVDSLRNHQKRITRSDANIA